MDDTPILTKEQVNALKAIYRQDGNCGEWYADTNQMSNVVIDSLAGRDGWLDVRHEDGVRWARILPDGILAMQWHVLTTSSEVNQMSENYWYLNPGQRDCLRAGLGGWTDGSRMRTRRKWSMQRRCFIEFDEARQMYRTTRQGQRALKRIETNLREQVRPLTEREKGVIVDCYLSCEMTMREIAESYDVSYAQVQRAVASYREQHEIRSAS